MFPLVGSSQSMSTECKGEYIVLKTVSTNGWDIFQTIVKQVDSLDLGIKLIKKELEADKEWVRSEDEADKNASYGRKVVWTIIDTPSIKIVYTQDYCYDRDG